MKKISVFLVLFILIIGCTKEFLNPDVRAVSVSPLGYYIVDPVGVIVVDSVTFTAANSQDAHITGFFWEFYDNETLIYARPDPFPLSVAVPGLVHPTEADTTRIMGLLVNTAPLSQYMFTEGVMQAGIKLRFISEADYFPDRTDTSDIIMGIGRLESLSVYFAALTVAPDSLPRDSATVFAEVTATLNDFANNPVVGAELEFSVSDDTIAQLSQTYAVTNTEGTALVYLSCIDNTPGLIWIWVTVNHPYAYNQLRVPVKFY